MLANSGERIGLGGTPGVEEFARFAFGDVEMGPLRQPAGYCGHNLTSVCARSSASLGQEVRLTCNQLAGGLGPFPRTGCFRKAWEQCGNRAPWARAIAAEQFTAETKERRGET